MDEKIHYIRRTPGLGGHWFGTSDFDETKDKVIIRDMNKGRKYPITLTHAQSGEGAHLRVFWKWPGKNKTIIPGDVLFHNKQNIKSIRKEAERDRRYCYK